MIELNKIYNEDCLEGMKKIPGGSVDCIVCDLPYEVLNKKQHKTMKVRLAKKLALRPMCKLSTRWIMRYFNNDARFNKAFRMIKRKRK